MWFRNAVVMACLASGLLPSQVAAGRFADMHRNPHKIAREEPVAQKRDTRKNEDGFRFLNKDTTPYRVESLPDVPFDVGEMYSGLIPIDPKNKSRELFFVFQPTIGEPVDEITIWLNGGPGCSSLEGFFQENGRFVWPPGTFAPVENQYSWVNLTNMLWVEQPVGTGFSIGTPTATSEEEIAQDFVQFFKNFEKLFGIKKFKIYVTGESYAGRYVPFISAAMLDEKDKEYFDLNGALVYDPCIGQFDYVQQKAPTVPFVQQYANIFNFNASFMAELENLHKSCGYEDFIDKFFVFPPAGVQPPKSFNYTSENSCDVFDLVINEALGPNPCWDVYMITATCPLQWDVLGFPTEFFYTPPGASIYFDRADVKEAIHAPQKVNWTICTTDTPVFIGDGGPESEGDLSANPIEHVLPQVIEATNRVLVSNGDYDMIILTNGTLLSIQNMTWNGHLGFQSAPSTPIEIDLPDLQYADVFEQNAAGGLDARQGIMGVQHFERGLMWAESYQAGHMQPQYQPRLTYRHLEWLLGRIDTL